MSREKRQEATGHTHGQRDCCCPTALDLVLRLLEPGAEPAPEPQKLMSQLTRAFAATEAGISGFKHGVAFRKHRARNDNRSQPTDRWPWEEEPGLLARVLNAPQAVVQTAKGDSHLLLASSGVEEGICWLIWVKAPTSQNWNADQRVGLTLTALAVGRRLTTECGADARTGWLQGARLRQRLDSAALTVRRLTHDLNNIFTSILGFTELSLSAAPSGSEAEQFMKEAYEVAQRGANLAAQLRLFSRRDPGQPQATPVAPVIGEAVARHTPTRETRLTLQAAVANNLPPVVCASETLHQVLARLLDNACEAIPSQGSVTLSAREVSLSDSECLELVGDAATGPHIEITVTDTGRGFSAEARERVFAEPFFSTKPRHGGLGLAVTYGLLCANHGGLRVEHGAQGGTSVQVYLPALSADTQPSPEARRSLHGERILVVDDDPLILRLMCATLERAGYRVASAVNGQKAIEAYTTAHEPFQLVLSDVVMPRMTGWELTRQLMDFDARVNVLFISGQAPPEISQAGLAERRFGLLLKPFHPDGLLQAVHAALGRGGDTREKTGAARN